MNNNNTTRQMSGHVRTRIGASSTNDSADEFFDGQLAEVLIYKGALSAVEVAEVNGYLALKYGFADNLASNLVLHCMMDNDQVSKGNVNPPPALNTDDGDWIVEDWTTPVESGTATAVNVTGEVTSSEPGIIGEAIRFSDSSGGDRHVDFGDADSLEAGAGSLTVSLWFKPSAMGGTQFVAAHGNAGSAGDGWSIWLDNTTLHIRCNSGNVNNNANKAELLYSGLLNDTWYHVVIVLDRNGNKLRGYMNGSVEGFAINPTWTDTFTVASITSANKPLHLGIRNDLAAELKGAVDDFAIWKRALTGNEIATIYYHGKEGVSFIAAPADQGTLILIH